MSEERRIDIPGPHQMPGGGWSTDIDKKTGQMRVVEFDTREEAS
ncbi:MAG: hypothetical protein OXQ84_22615 [bacterium]|nr:hypothetical protein [bacterium]